ASGRPSSNIGLPAVASGSTKNVAGTARSSRVCTRGANRAGRAGCRPHLRNMLVSQDRRMVEYLVMGGAVRVGRVGAGPAGRGPGATGSSRYHFSVLSNPARSLNYLNSGIVSN